MRQIHNTSFNTQDDSLASYDNSNNFGFSPGCGEAITVCLANQLAILSQSISAQVTAEPHRPWYSTWCNTSWQICHTTLLYEKTIDLTSKHQKHQPSSLTSFPKHPVSTDTDTDTDIY